MNKKIQKPIHFYSTKKDSSEYGILVEFDKTQHCNSCDKTESYWIGGNISICKDCIPSMNQSPEIIEREK
mgnify:CR=1 FL=1